MLPLYKCYNNPDTEALLISISLVYECEGNRGISEVYVNLYDDYGNVLSSNGGSNNISGTLLNYTLLGNENLTYTENIHLNLTGNISQAGYATFYSIKNINATYILY